MNDHIYKRRTAGALLAVLAACVMLLPAKVLAAGNIPAKVDIGFTYTVKGDAQRAGNDSFTLTAEDPLSPMPPESADGKKTIKVDGEGSYSFGAITYLKPGIHWYTISRELTESKGVKKDDTVYRVKVTALNDGHGYVSVYRDGSDEKTEPEYTDTTTPETGDGEELMLMLGLTGASAAALAAFAATFIRRRKGGAA